MRDTADEELVTPLGNFVAAAKREPDLVEELDRADEAAETEVDEETPSPAQQRQLLSPRQSGSPSNWRILSRIAKWSMPPRSCQVGKTLFQMSRVRSTTDAENPAGGSFAKVLPFSTRFAASTRWKFGIRWTEKIQFEYRTSSGTGHMLPPGRTQAGHDSYRDFCHTATILAQTQKCHGSFDHGPGYRVWCRFSTSVPIQGYPARGDWFGNAVAKLFRRETWSPVQDGLQESVQSGSPDDGELDELIAELNRRVGRAGFSLGQRGFGRQLRLPSSLFEDDFIDPNTIVQYANHEMRRSEAMPMAAAHGCVVAADRRAMTTAAHSRQRKPQQVLVAGEPVFIH